MIRYGIIASLILGAFVWGLAAGAYKLFPYPQIESLHQTLTQDPEGPGYRDSESATQRGLEMADWETKAEIVMIGDSITEFAPWKDMFPDADILNRGASGDTVSGVEKRLDAILRAEPKRAFVLIGTNDLNLENPIDDVMAIYGRVVAKLQANQIEVTLQTVPGCGEALSICTDKRRAAEDALNKGIAELARQNEIELIDLAVAFPRGSEYRADGVHPTVKGYKVWRDVLEPYVLRAEAGEQTE